MGDVYFIVFIVLVYFIRRLHSYRYSIIKIAAKVVIREHGEDHTILYILCIPISHW